MKRFQYVACLIALMFSVSVGCSAPSNANIDDVDHGGSAERGDNVGNQKRLTITPNFEALNSQFSGDQPMTTIEDAFTVTVKLGDKAFRAGTHLFPGTLTLIPYDDGQHTVVQSGSNSEGPIWNVGDREIADARGEKTNLRGDEVLARYFAPGEIGYAIKHHRPEHRTLSLEAGADLKETVKLQDTHIELVVGVERPSDHDHNPATPDVMVPGVITLNNPQDYEEGRFGDPSYPMIFVENKYPQYLSNVSLDGAPVANAFETNVRTMMLGLNAVSNFPGDYNGGDPLGARNPAQLRALVGKMIQAIAGDEDALDWFKESENNLYCAELAFVAASAGLHFPLNEETFVKGGIVDAETWAMFGAELAKHNAGEPTIFTIKNENGLARLVDGALAPAGLKPVWQYAPTALQAAESQKLAFQPLTMADIVDSFLSTHMPRAQFGEALAPAQAALLSAMQPGLLEAMTLDDQTIANAAGTEKEAHLKGARAKVDALYAALVQAIGQQYESYTAFRAALEPLMAQARVITGPRGDTGVGLFVPPSLLHMVAQGRFEGLIGLQYVGHGLHFSQLNVQETPESRR